VNGCLGLGEHDNHLQPKCIDSLRGKHVRWHRCCSPSDPHPSCESLPPSLPAMCIRQAYSSIMAGLAPLVCSLQMQDFSCGFSHVVAVTTAGETYTWGDNSYFQCGLGIEVRHAWLPSPPLLHRFARAYLCVCARVAMISVAVA
jgi:hypothetical protein